MLSGNKNLPDCAKAKKMKTGVAHSSLRLRLCRRVIPALSCLDELLIQKQRNQVTSVPSPQELTFNTLLPENEAVF